MERCRSGRQRQHVHGGEVLRQQGVRRIRRAAGAGASAAPWQAGVRLRQPLWVTVALTGGAGKPSTIQERHAAAPPQHRPTWRRMLRGCALSLRSAELRRLQDCALGLVTEVLTWLEPDNL